MPINNRRKCVICGATVINRNPKTTTCDPVCTRAKHAGKTRLEQTQEDMRREEWMQPMTIEDCDGDSLD